MSQSNRALFIDLLKGIALLVMIEVHVVNSFLVPEIKSYRWFELLNYINGLVAPAFTFTSGMVFVLSLQKGLDELRKFGKKFWKKLGRLILIFIAGYLLHASYLSLKKISNPSYPHMIKELLRVDILQCIAVGLIILLLLRIIIKSDKVYYVTLILIDLFILAYSPIAWKIDFTKIFPLGIANYFNRQHGSLFPIFPWFAFIFTGALTGKYYVEAKNKIGELKFVNNLSAAGLIFFITGIMFLNYLFPQSLVNVKPNFFFFLQRLGIIFILLRLCWHYLEQVKDNQTFILEVSRESLLVYWLHLKLLYIKILDGKSLIDLFESKLNIIQCLIITLLLAILMVLIAKGWGYLKVRYPAVISKLVFITVTFAVIIFFTF
ncbi:heparan-alpha-glucosaminide N-acetyltransferase domain-containing protein [Rosettibacter firmus]|uniref:heparan-alpha-glucosaminide N-acetyltransferase domain-containing protein n=1 Tax=Rosettibacter firmus TaxID=3111522 RepID=UPI00336BBD65